jgi:hypothetical protein
MRRILSTALAATGFTLVSLLSPPVAAAPAFLLLTAASFLVLRSGRAEGR